jgi:glycosyltransferase involved in cell wall biosynthesis
MKVSIITVTKNSALTIKQTVLSVLTQEYSLIEHIIKDASSVDQTLRIAKSINPSVVALSNIDAGIYDAMNQGFAMASGEIVAFLNSDDRYIDDNVLLDVIRAFNDYDCDFVYGDILMVSATGIVLREWKTGMIGDAGLVGRQIPHPSFFIRRGILDKLDLPFDPSYRISADLKQQLLIINKLKLRGYYLSRPLVLMKIGGESTNSFSSYFLGWKESIRAYNEVFGRGGALFVLKKVISKISGLRLGVLLSPFGK